MTGFSAMQNFYFYDSLPSTNDRARELARDGAPSGTVVLAGRQTAGRGRLGRSFFSPPGAGLYMSLVLRPVLSPESALSITAAAAVSVRRALCRLLAPKAEIRIKWVNDLLLDGKKICGILTESGPLLRGGDGAMRFSYAVVGIGINLAKSEALPEALEPVAGSLGLPAEEAAEMRLPLAEAIRGELCLLLSQMEENERNCRPPFSPETVLYYNEHAAMRGKKITVTEGLSTYEAQAEDIDAYGHLRILWGGKTEILKTGEITVRAKPEPGGSAGKAEVT